MASLKDIRRRIGSVKNTQQITKAMKLVAAAKLRRAQQAIVGARPFAQKIEELTSTVMAEVLNSAANLSGEKRESYLASVHPLLKQEEKRTSSEEGAQKSVIALLVVSSDRGLCGAYNTNILRFANRRIQALQSEGYEVKLFFAGKRGNDFFTKRGFKGEHFPDFWQGRFTTDKAHRFARKMVERFLSGEFARVEVCYTEFKSALSQSPQAKTLLPLKVDASQNDGAEEKSYIFKQDRQSLLGQLLPKQVETQFYRCFAESLASEFGARMTSMDNATRNASEMISKLTLEANRVRQAAITKELMEIIGGAEALK